MSEPASPPRPEGLSRLFPLGVWGLLLAGAYPLTPLPGVGRFTVLALLGVGFAVLYGMYVRKAWIRRGIPLARVHTATGLLLMLAGSELLLRRAYPLPLPFTLLVLIPLFLSFFVGRRAAMLLGLVLALWGAFLWPPSLFSQVFWHRMLIVMAVLLVLYPLSRRRDFYRLAFVLFGAAFLGQVGFHQWAPLSTLVPAVWQPLLWAFVETMAILALLFLLLPGLERWLHMTTDFSLLELLRLDHPLLVDLARKAPGTFEHSLAVANLAETAARAIGANPLLARVGGLFHDIGKMLRPEYFIENKGGRANPHDRLSPRLSVLILRDHVIQGVRLAREHGLPEDVVAIIQTHHGTSLIRPFFAKAREQGDHPDPSEFRYPGPRPRTKEQAIVMLADSVEAACRSLPEPTPARIEETLDRILRWKMEENQLDEADLSLREIRTIREAFLPVLLGQYHHRITYPGEEAETHVRPRAPRRKAGALTPPFE